MDASSLSRKARQPLGLIPIGGLLCVGKGCDLSARNLFCGAGATQSPSALLVGAVRGKLARFVGASEPSSVLCYQNGGLLAAHQSHKSTQVQGDGTAASMLASLSFPCAFISALVSLGQPAQRGNMFCVPALLGRLDCRPVIRTSTPSHP